MLDEGIFIAVEGIDGAGKTTQVRLLRDALESLGENVVVSKEPTNGQWGALIRQTASAGRLPPDEELDLFIKDRTEHLETVVLPALQEGSIVVLDRYFYSTIAYQGGRGMDPKDVHVQMLKRFRVPDAVFLLDIDPELSVNRIEQSRGEVPNHFEDRRALATSRAIFKQIEGKELLQIDGSGTWDEIHSTIIRAIVAGPLKERRCAKVYGCDNPVYCVPNLTGTCLWAKYAGTLINRISPTP